MGKKKPTRRQIDTQREKFPALLSSSSSRAKEFGQKLANGRGNLNDG